MSANTYGRQVVLPLTNKSGGGVIAGDVVIIDTTNNDAFTTSTAGAVTSIVGIAQETIANNAAGRVLMSGYAALINVNASVTRGNYGKTHTVAKQATDAGASRVTGTFVQFFTGGTTPDGQVFNPDLGAGSGTNPPTVLTGPMDPNAITGAINFGNANRAMMMPFWVPQNVTVSAAYYSVVNSTGNFDAGIYDSSLNLLKACGSTATPAAGKHSTALTGSQALVPGTLYYAAFAMSDATATFLGVDLGTSFAPGINFWRRGESMVPLANPFVVTANNDLGKMVAVFFA